MSRAIVLPSAVRRAILAHARRDRPRECCGLLLGRGQQVAYAAPMPNVSGDPARYRVDDRAHIDVRRAIRALVPPLEILGVYHSHPHGPAEPSPTDVAEAWSADWTYLIVGLGARHAQWRAFRFIRGRAETVQIRPYSARRR